MRQALISYQDYHLLSLTLQDLLGWVDHVQRDYDQEFRAAPDAYLYAGGGDLASGDEASEVCPARTLSCLGLCGAHS